MTGSEMAAAAAVGYAVQWVKAFKRLPTWMTQLGTVAAVAACYAVFVEVPTTATWQAWAREVVWFGMAALGVASVAGAAGAAPKTDSIH